jgi:hypothetical protein
MSTQISVDIDVVHAHIQSMSNRDEPDSEAPEPLPWTRVELVLVAGIIACVGVLAGLVTWAVVS